MCSCPAAVRVADRSAGGPLERHIAFRAGEDGTITRVDSVPPNLEHEPGMIARAPGERVYMRLSATYDSVFVLTRGWGSLHAALRADP